MTSVGGNACEEKGNEVTATGNLFLTICTLTLEWRWFVISSRNGIKLIRRNSPFRTSRKSRDASLRLYSFGRAFITAKMSTHADEVLRKIQWDRESPETERFARRVND